MFPGGSHSLCLRYCLCCRPSCCLASFSPSSPNAAPGITPGGSSAVDDASWQRRQDRARVGDQVWLRQGARAMPAEGKGDAGASYVRVWRRGRGRCRLASLRTRQEMVGGAKSLGGDLGGMMNSSVTEMDGDGICCVPLHLSGVDGVHCLRCLPRLPRRDIAPHQRGEILVSPSPGCCP